MSKFLDNKGGTVQLADYAHRRFHVRLRPTDTFADLFVPTFWAHHRSKFGLGDHIEVEAHDRHWAEELIVTDLKPDGVVVQRYPITPSAEEEAAAAEIGKAERYVPFANDGKPAVRVEHTPATNWRVLGIDGNEISRDHKDEPAARKAMVEYLKGIRYVMPNEDDQAAELDRHNKRVAAQEAANKARREARAVSRR